MVSTADSSTYEVVYTFRTSCFCLKSENVWVSVFHLGFFNYVHIVVWTLFWSYSYSFYITLISCSPCNIRTAPKRVDFPSYIFSDRIRTSFSFCESACCLFRMKDDISVGSLKHPFRIHVQSFCEFGFWFWYWNEFFTERWSDDFQVNPRVRVLLS